jgi:hypothetical protein
MRFKDAAYEILKNAEEHLRYNEITDNAIYARSWSLANMLIYWKG